MKNHVSLKNLELLVLRTRITQAINQTKDWRRSQSWYQGGKKCECEKYQRILIEKITGKECSKTNDRINTFSNQIIHMRTPMTREDAFDWTEDFDGIQETSGFQLYYNFKMVCDSGGAQTRTLREVAHFIRAQGVYNLQHYQYPKYFINILDGDESSRLYSKYQNILNTPKYKFIKKFIYIGDLHGFVFWFMKLNIQ